MSLRVGVFIDYQNVYKGARRAFGMESMGSKHGAIRPSALAELICSRSSGQQSRTLVGVYVYSGVPSQRQNQVRNAASRRQILAWKRNPLVNVTTHTLQPKRGKVGQPDLLEEKGIDVSLAIDFVYCATKGEFDVGVIFSTDTDFEPVLDKAREIGIEVESAVWWHPPHMTRELGAGKDPPVWCHRLDIEDYREVRDKTWYGPHG